MNDKTLNVPDWWPDEHIPIYHAKETLEPKQLYISTAGIHNNTYDLLMKQYRECIDHLAYQQSCSAPKPTYLKVSEEFAHYLKDYYNPEIPCDAPETPSGTNGRWFGIPFVVDGDLKDKLYEFEFADEKEKQKFERGLRAKIPLLYNDVMTEDGLTLMTNEDIETITDKWNSIGCTSFVLTPEELEHLLQQAAEENKNVTK